MLGNMSETAIPKIGKCFLCEKWVREDTLMAILVSDQGGGHVEKGACPSCYASVLGPEGHVHKGIRRDKEK